DILKSYGALASREERDGKIVYMLDRITGRIPPPAEYAARLPKADAAPPAEASGKSDRPPKAEPSRRDAPRDQRSSGERDGRRERKKGRDDAQKGDGRGDGGKRRASVKTGGGHTMTADD